MHSGTMASNQYKIQPSLHQSCQVARAAVVADERAGDEAVSPEAAVEGGTARGAPPRRRPSPGRRGREKCALARARARGGCRGRRWWRRRSIGFGRSAEGRAGEELTGAPRNLAAAVLVQAHGFGPRKREDWPARNRPKKKGVLAQKKREQVI